MERERIDPIYKYVDKYIDEKLKSIKTDLQQLKDGLLRTQRHLAHLHVRVTHGETVSQLARRRLPSEFVSELTAARIKIDTPSEDPLSVADEFEEKRWADLEKKFGIKPLKVTS